MVFCADYTNTLATLVLNMTFRYCFLMNADLFLSFCVFRAFSYLFFIVYLTRRLVLCIFTIQHKLVMYRPTI